MSEHFQVAIIGAGPAGLGAALNAAEHKLSHILFEKREVGNTVFDYQLRKHVMAEPDKLPLRSQLPFVAGTREEILDGWNSTAEQYQVNLRKGEVTAIAREGERFTISSPAGDCTANNIVLAIGIQGTPRKLNVPGDDSRMVQYTLSDPDAFVGKDILVVGAGDAAIENAIALTDKNSVSLLNRAGEFARAKDANAALVLSAEKAGKLKVFYNSSMARIEGETAFIDTPDGEVSMHCDVLIARIGAIPPRKFVEACGIEFPSADREAYPVVNGKYESNVSGLYIVGSLIGYPLIKHGINQGYEVIEHILGNPVEPADQPLLEESIGHLPGDTKDNLKMLLDGMPLFAGLSEPQFRELIIESTVHQTAASDVVFKENDYTDTFFTIVSGSVAVDLPDGKEVAIGAGNFFGEMGLISGRRRSATIRVKDAGLIVESPRKQILKLISSVESVKDTIDRSFALRALQTKIFPDAAFSFLEELVSRAEARDFKKGDVLFREGDEGDVLYVIRKGSVKISRVNSAGVDVAQTYIPAGNYVGEMALLDPENDRRSATVTAAVACQVLAIGKEDFTALLQKNPAVRERVEALAAERRVENITSSNDELLGGMLDFVTAEGITDAENVLLIDSDLCVGCDNCEQACAATHQGYSRLDRKGGKSFASLQVPVSCRHCENPLCMTDCPPDALTRMPDGEVVIRDSCIGCGNCVRNCPYGVIQMVYSKPKHGFSLFSLFSGDQSNADGDKGVGKAGKCDMCSKLDSGPACVRSCPTGAAMRVNPRKMLDLIASKKGL